MASAAFLVPLLACLELSFIKILEGKYQYSVQTRGSRKNTVGVRPKPSSHAYQVTCECGLVAQIQIASAPSLGRRWGRTRPGPHQTPSSLARSGVSQARHGKYSFSAGQEPRAVQETISDTRLAIGRIARTVSRRLAIAVGGTFSWIRSKGPHRLSISIFPVVAIESADIVDVFDISRVGGLGGVACSCTRSKP